MCEPDRFAYYADTTTGAHTPHGDNTCPSDSFLTPEKATLQYLAHQLGNTQTTH